MRNYEVPSKTWHHGTLVVLECRMTDVCLIAYRWFTAGLLGVDSEADRVDRWPPTGPTDALPRVRYTHKTWHRRVGMHVSRRTNRRHRWRGPHVAIDKLANIVNCVRETVGWWIRPLECHCTNLPAARCLPGAIAPKSDDVHLFVDRSTPAFTLNSQPLTYLRA